MLDCMQFYSNMNKQVSKTYESESAYDIRSMNQHFKPIDCAVQPQFENLCMMLKLIVSEVMAGKIHTINNLPTRSDFCHS